MKVCFDFIGQSTVLINLFLAKIWLAGDLPSVAAGHSAVVQWPGPLCGYLQGGEVLPCVYSFS